MLHFVLLIISTSTHLVNDFVFLIVIQNVVFGQFVGFYWLGNVVFGDLCHIVVLFYMFICLSQI
ncbi:hypothetical protein TUM17377_08930 [Shewanella chilikensis]|nr:hypothetical protein TUM17377_08930 [Shewanella chilikensis]